MRQVAKTIDKVEADLEDKPVTKRDEPKKLSIHRNPNGLYSVQYSAGGEVPDELKTLFTSSNRAQIAIDNYLVTKQEAA
jgi:hypothetical protein